MTNWYNLLLDPVPFKNHIMSNFNALVDGSKALEKLVVDNITIDGNTISSTLGDINIAPLAGEDVVIDVHWEFDGATLTMLTDNDTVIAAYAGKNITIESVTFDGGAVAAVTSLAGTGAVSGFTTISCSGDITTSGGNAVVSTVDAFIGADVNNGIVPQDASANMIINGATGVYINLDSNNTGGTGDFVIGRDRNDAAGSGTTIFTIDEATGDITATGEIIAALAGAAPGSLKAVYFNTGTGQLTYDNS